MNSQENTVFIFQTSAKSNILIMGILTVGSLSLILIGIIVELFGLIEPNIGLFLATTGSAFFPFAIIGFLYFYIPSKNILFLDKKDIGYKAYRGSDSFSWKELKSLKIQFHPAGKVGGDEIASSLIIASMEAVSEAIDDKEKNAVGKISVELYYKEGKKKLHFFNLLPSDIGSLGEKVTKFTNIKPEKQKYLLFWQLS
jgi:hypothetical protein